MRRDAKFWCVFHPRQKGLWPKRFTLIFMNSHPKSAQPIPHFDPRHKVSSLDCNFEGLRGVARNGLLVYRGCVHSIAPRGFLVPTFVAL